MLQVRGLHKAISCEMCVTYAWSNLSISLTSVIIFVLLLFLNGSLFGIHSLQTSSSRGVFLCLEDVGRVLDPWNNFL